MSRVEFAYDARGQLVHERLIGHGRDDTLIHELDALGNRESTRLPDGRRINWLHYGSQAAYADPPQSRPCTAV